MFISTCLKCHDEDKYGKIVTVDRPDEDGDTCDKCGEVLTYAYTDRSPGIADGDYSHTSASLAINPSQARVHKKLFPGIGIKNDGQLHFDSVRKQSDYLKKTGFQKKPQKKEY